ncbi:glucokinase [Roseovarius sp. B08]|uniref:glucokinase n=1 Tax=Roseovarius sp. B08 TaxID=3449223 RepID=UPI003EDC4C41
MEPERLVADIGGTNARIGLAANGSVRADTVRTYRNADFSSLEALLKAYCGDRQDIPHDAALAAAGPKSGDAIRLTNRDWTILPRTLRDALGFRRVGLVNDLEALGLSLPQIAAHSATIYHGRDDGPQSLVVGIGTGFNVCPALRLSTGASVTLSSETGHASLPSDIAALVAPFGVQARVFEDIFSGSGFLALFRATSGIDVTDPSAATRLMSEEAEATSRFGRLYGACLARLVRHLTSCFLPTGGIYFAGSVARSALRASFTVEELRALRGPSVLGEDWIPAIRLVEYDDAALTGLAQLSLSESDAVTRN